MSILPKTPKISTAKRHESTSASSLLMWPQTMKGNPADDEAYSKTSSARVNSLRG